MTIRLMFLAVTALFLSSCGDANDNSGDTSSEMPASVSSTADEDAIRSLVDRWHQLIDAKEAAAIAQLYTEDGAVMPPNSPIGKGRSAIEQTWSAMLQTPGFDLAIVPEEIVVSSSGDMALDRGTYRLVVTPEGTEVIDTGKYVVVWRKIEGEWKAAADIFNSDLPPGGG